MHLYRLGKTAFIKDLTGIGGLYSGGRWNEKGTRIIYTAQALSLAKLEILASTKETPEDYSYIVLNIPDTISIKTINVKELSKNWQQFPHPKENIYIAEDWIKKREHLIMKVPSVHSPMESNFLINPLHPDMNKISIIDCQRIVFDIRLKQNK